MIYSPTINPYAPPPNTNALFTFNKGGGFELDSDTGNYIPTNTEVILCTATLVQKKDPNLILQPGIDYTRTYFDGYLVEPKQELLAVNSKEVPATINGLSGVFDFVPIYDNAEAITFNVAAIIGQKVAGYFREQV